MQPLNQSQKQNCRDWEVAAGGAITELAIQKTRKASEMILNSSFE